MPACTTTIAGIAARCSNHMPAIAVFSALLAASRVHRYNGTLQMIKAPD